MKLSFLNTINHSLNFWRMLSICLILAIYFLWTNTLSIREQLSNQESFSSRLFNNQIYKQTQDDNRKTIYEAISKDYDIGKYDEYLDKLKSPNKRKQLYPIALQYFYYTDFASFENDILDTIPKWNSKSFTSDTLVLEQVKHFRQQK